MTQVGYHKYDKNTIYWLEAEGFNVVETSDQREGDFITVKW